MTRLQRLLRRQSELKIELGDALDCEQRDDGAIKRLTVEARSLEGDLLAARLVEPDGDVQVTDTADAQDTELLKLRSEYSVGRVMQSAADSTALQGVEAEYNAEYSLDGASFPAHILTRAVTPGPATTGVNAQEIAPAVFAQSLAAFLGVAMPTVPAGDAAFPVLSTSVTAGVKAKSVTSAETAGAVTLASIEPRRCTGSFRVRLEDTYRLPTLEDALRLNLDSVLSEAVDNQLLNGSGSGDGTVNGLFAILGDATAPASGQETLARYAAAFGSHVDGKLAGGPGEIRGAVGPATMRHMLSVFATNTSTSAFDYIERTFGGVRTSSLMPGKASNIQQAIVARGLGGDAAQMPVWDRINIRDITSASNKGEIVVTAVALVGDVTVTRTGAFVADSFRIG